MRSLGAGSCSVIEMLTHWTPLYLGTMITTIKSCNKKHQGFLCTSEHSNPKPGFNFSFLAHRAIGIEKNLAGRKYSGSVVEIGAPEGEACVDI